MLEDISHKKFSGSRKYEAWDAFNHFSNGPNFGRLAQSFAHLLELTHHLWMLSQHTKNTFMENFLKGY